MVNHHKVYLPMMSGCSINIHGIRKRAVHAFNGGSILLQKGGPGVGSSYSDLNDYMNTTQLNPYNTSSAISGRGFSRLHKHLENLTIMPKKPKSKNINFSM